MSPINLKYRANVAAILRNQVGKILICERLGMPEAWQFPQGGIDPGETPEQALNREVGEEISVKPEDLRIILKRGPYYYRYDGGRTKKGFHGKEQTFFLCEYLGADEAINVHTKHPEFQAFRWIFPRDFRLTWLPEMKREVFRAVFLHVFGLKL